MIFYTIMLNLSAFIKPFFIILRVENVRFNWTLVGDAIVTVFFIIPVSLLVHRYGNHMCGGARRSPVGEPRI